LSPTIFLKKESLAQAMAAGRDEQIWLIDSMNAPAGGQRSAEA